LKVLFLSGLLPKKEKESIETTSYALPDMVLGWQQAGLKIMTIRPLWVPAEGLVFQGSNLQFKELKIKIVPVFRAPVIFKYAGTSILRSLKKHGFEPDVIIAHMSHSIRLGNFLQNRIKKPMIAGIHAGDLRLLIKNPGFLLPQLKASDGIWARSIVIRKSLQQFDSLAEKEIGLCFSGIDKRILGDKSRIMGKWDPENLEVIRFISAGNLIELKNFGKVILGLSKFEGKDWSYEIYGDGPKKGELEGQISSLGLSEKVTLKGFKPNEEILQSMEKSHFHVMPSKGETFGLSFMEAAAKGCINIGLKNSGIDGIYEDTVNSIMLEEPIEDDLALRLNNPFSSNSPGLKSMALKSFNRVQEFESGRLARDQINFISKTINNWNSL
jgi:glycosyltransferase involved in cell wall biosynthesis